ncbi:MAG: glycosyltransferase family 2 protein [bacterium]|nr:glycosyltransferase family 2 protein [bacterium]
MDKVHLSLVIPAYNEAERIPATLALVRDYLARQSYDSEIVVVDDGSTDGTAAIVREISDAIRIIAYTPNRGKGHAVRAGMMAAEGAYRVYFDADASTPIEEVGRLWERFEDGADVVIGSRSLPDSDVQVHQSWFRQNLGRAFNTVLKLFRLTPFIDTQCGFKAFTAAACDVVFARQTVERFSFDAELLLIAQDHGLRIDELPVRWVNNPNTRVRAVRDGLRMLVDLVRIRLNRSKGLYR